MTKSDLDQLEKVIGYSFKSRGLLEEALTHSSFLAGQNDFDNERLEFLGDRVLGLLVADQLYSQFPHEKEGVLARRLNSLICRPTCADIAREIDLGAYLRLGKSERPNDAAPVKAALLANACEALLGALYLDGGMDAIMPLFKTYWLPRFEDETAARRDAKTALQEWAQGKGLPLPEYASINRSGPDHAPQFTIGVSVIGYKQVTASGPSKRKGEQAAAEAFLIEHNIWQQN